MLASPDSVGITEAENVERWRLLTLIEAGYPLPVAEQIACRHEGRDAIDLHRAVDLVKTGCDPATAAKILL